MEKEIELYGMTLAELDTEVEIAKSAEVDEYVKTIKWSDDTDEYTKLLIVGNIRGFAFRKTTPETPINGFINKLAQRFAELTAREARLTEALEQVLREVPTNWCDPLLTGKSAVVATSDHREIEALLRGIQDRQRGFVEKALAEAQRIQEGK